MLLLHLLPCLLLGSLPGDISLPPRQLLFLPSLLLYLLLHCPVTATRLKQEGPVPGSVLTTIVLFLQAAGCLSHYTLFNLLVPWAHLWSSFRTLSYDRVGGKPRLSHNLESYMPLSPAAKEDIAAGVNTFFGV